jgi:hypothetical protein
MRLFLKGEPMLQDKLQINARVAGLEFWPYWFLQIVRNHRRSYSMKAHAQIEHGDVIVGWQRDGAALEAWNADHIALLLGDVQPSHEEWRAFAGEASFETPQPVWLSELQAAGLMVVAHKQQGARLRGYVRPMNRTTYEALGWMGRKREKSFDWHL